MTVSASDFTIRPATGSDTEALANLAALTFPDASPADMPHAALEDFMERNLSEQAFTEYLSQEKYLTHVAQAVSGELLGYTLVDLDPADIPDDAARPAVYFSKIYAHRAARGTGLSRALVEHVIAEVKKLGFVSGFLGTNQDNARGNTFYEKLGFEVVGTRELEVSAGVLGQDFVRVRNF